MPQILSTRGPQFPVVTAFDSFAPFSDQPVGSPAGGPWTSAWHDEFDFPVAGKPDPAIWADHYDIGDMERSNDNGTEVGWSPHNRAGLSVSSSILSLTARHEDPRNPASIGYDPLCPATNPAGNTPVFSDAVLQSLPCFSQTYGFWEAKVKLPLADGEWVAFWMDASDAAWPPEFDIMEQFGTSEQFGQTYFPDGGGSNGNQGIVGSNVTGSLSGFHVYGMRWDATTIAFYCDGSLLYTATGTITSLPCHVLFDFEVQANSGASYPATMQAEYVRVWTKTGVPARPVISSVTPSTGVPSAGSIQVSFGAVSGATSYRAIACPKDALADGVAGTLGSRGSAASPATGSASPLTITGLANGVHYAVRVAAINATGYSTESAAVPSF